MKKFNIILIVLTFVSLGLLSVKAADRALVVGVDFYADKGLNPTDGAVDDAKAMQKLLIEQFGFPPSSIRMLLNEQATARNISASFQSWLINETRPGDRVFFFYAGHGFQAPDDNGDEKDRMDEVITPYDVTILTSGSQITLPDENTFIRDDKFNDFIAELSGRRSVFIFDSCNSGTISRDLGSQTSKLRSRYLSLKPSRSLSGGVDSEVPNDPQRRDLTTIREDSLDGNINGVVVLSAASPYQQAFPIETRNKQIRGAFSYLFEELIRRNPLQTVNDLEKSLKSEMRNLGDSGLLGRGRNGEFQVPQVDVVSKSNIAQKPLFAAGALADDYTAAVESALFNPLSRLDVKLELSKRRYKIGESITYTVDVGQDVYLYILVFSNQNKAFCVFPTGDSDSFVNKGRISFPRGNYVTEAAEPAGKDVWVALASRKKLRLGDKEEYSWDEMFQRIGLEELRKAIVVRHRGVRVGQAVTLAPDDWQADAIVVETVR
jgi:hypothetical protein